MFKKTCRLFCAAALIALGGCGVKGDLYLPPPPPADNHATPAKTP